MDRFGHRMLPAVAAALDLAPDWFDAAFEESQFSFRLSHYPPVTAGENQFGIAPHTDVNFMTFLPQSEVPGLEVLMPSGEWAPVPEFPDSFAVNSGDTLHRWTNGRFRSTTHRARPPVGTHRLGPGPHGDGSAAQGFDRAFRPRQRSSTSADRPPASPASSPGGARQSRRRRSASLLGCPRTRACRTATARGTRTPDGSRAGRGSR